ncbi:MAG: hypothetical protein ACI3ZO_10615 [Candidatus Cryptobacteroides sp.]|nr:hypothetical protein [Bacteroidales bacterium]
MTDIEKYLRDNKPEMPEEGQFLITTNARLEKVEGIKKCVDSEQRRNRKVLAAGLVIGLVIGCIVTLFILFCPAPEIKFLSSLFEKAAASIHKLRYLPAFLIAGCAIVLGVVSMNGQPRSDEMRF